MIIVIHSSQLFLLFQDDREAPWPSGTKVLPEPWLQREGPALLLVQWPGTGSVRPGTRTRKVINMYREIATGWTLRLTHFTIARAVPGAGWLFTPLHI